MLSCIAYCINGGKETKLWGLPFRPRFYRMIINLCKISGIDQTEVLKFANATKNDFVYANFSLEKLHIILKQIEQTLEFEYSVSFS